MFTLRMNGEVVAEVDEQVTKVRLITAQGEASATGIPLDVGVVDIVLDTVAPGGPPRLDQIEQMEAQAWRDRAREGVPVGNPPLEALAPAEGQRARQGYHVETLRPGGVDRKEQGTTVHNHPLKDLFGDLEPGDTATRTARIEAFGKHGDYDRALKDNPPGSGRQAEEEVAAKKAPTKQTAGAGASGGGSSSSGIKV